MNELNQSKLKPPIYIEQCGVDEYDKGLSIKVFRRQSALMYGEYMTALSLFCLFFS